tara:strand:- start:475 stop:690 length:216 start_codon:yes stop_codon:yes gene_type:complete
MKRQTEPSFNMNRLVRSAFNEEAYCSMMLDEMGGGLWSGEELDLLWNEAGRSDLTVAQFIEKHTRKGWHEL